MPSLKIPFAVLSLSFALAAEGASAPCVNRFVARSERPRQVVTMLTGKLTFQEARDLSAAINGKKSPPLEWITADGKSVGRQFGELKVVRPMPVGCDGKPSGVVMVVAFAATVKPEKQMVVKIDEDTTITLEQQGD